MHNTNHLIMCIKNDKIYKANFTHMPRKCHNFQKVELRTSFARSA